MDSIIKNPALIAVLVGVIAYTYLTWKRNQRQKKNKKNKKSNKNNNDLIITGAITVFAWFVVYGYMNYNVEKVPEKNIPMYKLVKETSESPKSFALVKPERANILDENQMPDVFIDNF